MSYCIYRNLVTFLLTVIIASEPQVDGQPTTDYKNSAGDGNVCILQTISPSVCGELGKQINVSIGGLDVRMREMQQQETETHNRLGQMQMSVAGLETKMQKTMPSSRLNSTGDVYSAVERLLQQQEQMQIQMGSLDMKMQNISSLINVMGSVLKEAILNSTREAHSQRKCSNSGIHFQ